MTTYLISRCIQSIYPWFTLLTAWGCLVLLFFNPFTFILNFFLLRSIYWLRRRYGLILRKYVWDFQRKYVEDNKRVKRVTIVFGDEQDSGDDIWHDWRINKVVHMRNELYLLFSIHSLRLSYLSTSWFLKNWRNE